MKNLCINCGKADVRPDTVRISGVVRSIPYEVEMHGLKCPNCGYGTVDAKGMTEFSRLLSDKWRAEHGFLTSDEIVTRRAKFNESQEQFAKRCKIGPATLKRIEKGKIQDADTNRRIIENTREPIVSGNQYLFYNVPQNVLQSGTGIVFLCGRYHNTNYIRGFNKPQVEVNTANTSGGYAPVMSSNETTQGWDVNIATKATPPWSGIDPIFFTRGSYARR